MMFESQMQNLDARDTCVVQFSGNLDFDDREAFRNELQMALEAQKGQIVLDLGAVRRMSSVYIGTILGMAANAQKDNRQVTLVAGGLVCRLCREAGVAKVLNLVDAGGESPPASA